LIQNYNLRKFKNKIANRILLMSFLSFILLIFVV
jgi:hypothetical protein